MDTLDFYRGQTAGLVAATWWADRLRDAVGVGDNGDNTDVSMLAGGMMQIIRSRNPPTAENIARFQSILAAKTAAAFEAIGDGRGTSVNIGCNWYYDEAGFDDGGPDLCLSVDYHPSAMLYDSLIEAGIEKNVANVAALPLKTSMKVSRRRILVKHGYGALFVEIFGPLWGCTYDEQTAADSHRQDMVTQAAYDEQDHYFPLHWSGPLPKDI